MFKFRHPVLAAALLAALPAAHAADLLLRIDADATRGSASYEISQVQKAGASGRSASRPARAGDLVIIGRDAQGRELFRELAANPSRQTAELWDPKTGQIVHSQQLATRGSVNVRIPQREGLSQIELHEFNERGLGGVVRRMAQAQLGSLLSRPRALAAASERSNGKLLWDSGPAAQRMDIVLIGDGFTAAESTAWQAAAQKVADGILADPLFDKFKNSLNIRRIDVESPESGVTEGGVTRKSALGTQIGCYNIDRLVCTDATKVNAAVSAVAPVDGQDVIIVLANSSTYAGSASGSIGGFSLHPQAIEIALHEIGHAAFQLADEYDYGTCDSASEPVGANATRNATRRGAKWAALIASTTPVPTTVGSLPNGTVGLFQGADYCSSGKYRPTETSRMRALSNPWHAVNEARAKAVFESFTSRVVAPTISAAPASVTVHAGQSAKFSVTASGSDDLRYQWKRNGVDIAGATSASYTTGAVDVPDNGAQYSVSVSNSAGSVVSAAATLTVQIPYTTVSGSLGASGASASLPGGNPGYLQSVAGGYFSARLSGPANANFDLQLMQWNGSSWVQAAKSASAGSSESLSLNIGAGYYYLLVRSSSGAGSFSLSYSMPR